MAEFNLVTLGCPKNLVDSEIMLSALKRHGFKETALEDAEVIIVNTCSFVQAAKEESVDTILELSQLKIGKCKVLAVSGCLSQRYSEALKKILPEVDLWISLKDSENIGDILKKYLHPDTPSLLKRGEGELKHNPSYPPLSLSGGITNPSPPREEGKGDGNGAACSLTPAFWSYLKISEGCSHQCSFCVIPSIRGSYRSREIDSLVEEAGEKADSGVKEIILIAQDSTDYGIDLYGERSLDKLLKRLSRIDGIKWIRVMYANPFSITDRLLDTLASTDKVCKYIDLPLQHSEEKILKLMKRAGNRKSTVELIEKIRKRIPGVSLRSSFIVGFPGESERDFRALKDFLKEVELDRVGAFTYSKEEGTSASLMEAQVHWKVRQKRYRELMELQQEITFKKNEKFVGKTIDVLIEQDLSREMNDDVKYTGRSYRDAPEIDGKVLI
ncbi:MAG: 30S ribosomal protein S12 methylthiotransferase RimO, partial [Firmicutes bacterium]|nr:30S ribosomal protein S12 methylthiotransferase RimO [Bacillota bacterium]